MKTVWHNQQYPTPFFIETRSETSMSQSNLETQKSSDPCHTERQMGRWACVEFNRGTAQRPFSHQRFSGQMIRKQKLVQSKGRNSTLCQPARDARGRRASRLELHTSHHTHLHDLWTPQRGCPSERAITPHRIVPPSTSKSHSACHLHTHKRRNGAIPRVCARSLPTALLRSACP